MHESAAMTALSATESFGFSDPFVGGIMVAEVVFMDEKDAIEVANFRYALIAPVVTGTLRRGELAKYLKEASKRDVHVVGDATENEKAFSRRMVLPSGREIETRWCSELEKETDPGGREHHRLSLP